MERLNDVKWQLRYCSSGLNSHGEPTNILHDFYLPALERIVRYDRVAGYFRSSSLAAASQGYTSFLQHGGVMRLIVGADLLLSDVAAILLGNQKRLSDKLMEELQNADEWPEEVKNGVALLGEMVSRDRLHVKVAFRVNSETNQPLAADSTEDGYVHEKWFLMEDEDAHRLYGSGSLNESRTALIMNAENIDIHCDWCGESDRERTEAAEADFCALWENRNPHMRVMELPEAVRNRLIVLRNMRNEPTETDGTVVPVKVQPTPEELLRFAVLKDAPKMPGGIYIGMYSAPVEPWPHQEIVSRRLIESFPYSYMMCDEVGLGKTIEAALALRSLILSGKADRVLIVAPASLTDQWQRELAQKAMLSFAKTKVKPGGTGKVQHSYIFPNDAENIDTGLYTPCYNIVSSGLVSRKERKAALISSADSAVILVDEAHYARRQNPRDSSLGNAKYGNLYRIIDEQLRNKTDALWLATATPMQIDAIEVYDLFRLTGRTGAFSADPSLSMTYFNLLGNMANGLPMTRQQWGLLGQSFAQIRALDPYLWDYLNRTAVSSKNRRPLKELTWKDPMRADVKYLKQPLFSASPLSRVMMRHTRQLLELYRQHGELNSNLAKRIVRPICAVKFTEEEEKFYDSLRDYCNGLNAQMRKYNPQTKQIMGFFLNFLQLRFASSIYAITQTLKRRLSRVEKTLCVGAHTFENEEELEELLENLKDTGEYDEEDLSEITFDALLKDRTPDDLKWEKERLEAMIEELSMIHQTPSKIQVLLDELSTRTSNDRMEQTVLFTRFYDSLKNIREELRIRGAGLRVGVFSGKTATWYNPEKGCDIGTSHEDIKRLFLAGKIDLLLCTDAAAEGLNLQTANLLINFDMGWNPMKIEQRIGRIDRIGQKYTEIEVMNMCYLGSTEEIVYGRLCDRLVEAGLVVGAQQISMLPVDQEQFKKVQSGELTLDELEKESRKRLKKQKEATASMEMSAQDMYDMYHKMSDDMKHKQFPATLDSIWDAFTTSPYLASLGGKIDTDGKWSIPSNELSAELKGTIDRALADSSEEFMTWGNPVIDEILDEMGSKTEELSCIRRLSAGNESAGTQVVGYLVGTLEGAKLVCSYDDADTIRIQQDYVFSEEEIKAAENELKLYSEEEKTRLQTVKNTVDQNRRFADIHEALIRCCSVEILQQLSRNGNTKYNDIIKVLTDNSEPSFTVMLPLQIFSEKTPYLLFSINENAGRISVQVFGELLNCCSELIQRTVEAMKKRKSEIMTEEIIHRLQNRKNAG